MITRTCPECRAKVIPWNSFPKTPLLRVAISCSFGVHTFSVASDARKYFGTLAELNAPEVSTLEFFNGIIRELRFDYEGCDQLTYETIFREYYTPADPLAQLVDKIMTKKGPETA